jgi:hypothetical protein
MGDTLAIQILGAQPLRQGALLNFLSRLMNAKPFPVLGIRTLFHIEVYTTKVLKEVSMIFTLTAPLLSKH